MADWNMRSEIPSKITEGDVETLNIIPLFFDKELLGFSKQQIKSKEYLAKKDIGKGATAKKGYVPDFSIYSESLPSLIIEAKSPENSAAEAFAEAQLYAHEINKGFNSGVNPCQLIFSTNGERYYAGLWDAKPSLEGFFADLTPGSKSLQELDALLGPSAVREISEAASDLLRQNRFNTPASLGAGAAMLNAKVEPNTFAADLAPTLRRYFSSRDQNSDPEIYDRAYISSNEVTSYDRILESFLKDRSNRLRQQQEIKTTRKSAPDVSESLRSARDRKQTSGELQLVTGGVGAGKSLFARRYKELLIPKDLKDSTHWAFVDFNEAVEISEDAREWLCKRFVQSLVEEGAPLDLRNEKDQERIFVNDLKDRKSFYDRVARTDPSRAELERARDLEMWRLDAQRAAKGAARYLQGDKADNLIVVFDNVDRRDSQEQLSAFQLALWFMSETRALVMLQLRDSTFEAYKTQPPLDTYRTGQIFHVGAPRFVDVVRRRLELSLEQFNDSTSGKVKYTTSKGITISYPRKYAGLFLKEIYREVFTKPKNIATVLEALAGRDVRRSLDMFMSIITSGHMPEEIIGSVCRGETDITIPEYLLLKVLMRGDYRFFSDNSGFVSNIFWTETGFVRPSNLMIIELLFYLISKRKVTGENGIIGYVALPRLTARLEHMGFAEKDIEETIKRLATEGLIEMDNFSSVGDLTEQISVKATASAWAHMRILSSRSEYLSSVIPVTPMSEDRLVTQAATALNDESRLGYLSLARRRKLILEFHSYLHDELARHLAHPGFEAIGAPGTEYILKKVAECIEFTGAPNNDPQLDLLDQ